jgi:hypothetical protein
MSFFTCQHSHWAPFLLEDEKTTILNVWQGKNERLGKKFYAKFGIEKPEDLDILMMVADWAKPTWKPKTTS